MLPDQKASVLHCIFQFRKYIFAVVSVSEGTWVDSLYGCYLSVRCRRKSPACALGEFRREACAGCCHRARCLSLGEFVRMAANQRISRAGIAA